MTAAPLAGTKCGACGHGRAAHRGHDHIRGSPACLAESEPGGLCACYRFHGMNTPPTLPAAKEVVMDATKTSKRTYDTGRGDKWTHGDPAWAFGSRWDGGPKNVFLGPCPACGRRTFDYGGGWRCVGECVNSAANPAPSVGPAPDWWADVRVMMDGSAWCAVRDDFVNLQESKAGFGASPQEAVDALRAVETSEPCSICNVAGECDEDCPDHPDRVAETLVCAGKDPAPRPVTPHDLACEAASLLREYDGGQMASAVAEDLRQHLFVAGARLSVIEDDCLVRSMKTNEQLREDIGELRAALRRIEAIVSGLEGRAIT